MQIPVNKDLDSYQDDFFKGLTLKQTALSILSVAAGTGMYLVSSYLLHLPQTISFYLALPVVLPIAATGFLRIHGMTPGEYIRRKRGVRKKELFTFLPDALLCEMDGEAGRSEKKTLLMLDDLTDKEVD